ncbi:hypothetical protein ACFLZW_04585 [Chloroflexota bacterium]
MNATIKFDFSLTNSQAIWHMRFTGDFSGEETHRVGADFGQPRIPRHLKCFIHHISKAIFVICLAFITAFTPILLSEVIGRAFP